MYDLQQLKCFIVLAEELHFGRAAARLNMTQSPLTRQIQLLERIIGVTLFIRNSRTVSLSQAGRFFYPEARRIIRMSEAATTLARRVEDGLEGAVSIGFTPTAAFSFMPYLASACLDRLPSIHVLLKEGTTREQLDGLASGEIDIGIIRPLLHRPQMNTDLLLKEPLVLAVPQGNPLAKDAKELEITDLRDQRFIGYAYDSRYFHSLVEAHFMTADVRPHLVQEVSNIHSILPLVSHGVGLALVPASAAMFFSRGIVFREIGSPLARQVELLLVTNHDRDDPIVARVVEVALDIRRATTERISEAIPLRHLARTP